MSTLLAVGFGYSAAALATRLKASGWRIIGTARNAAGLRAVKAKGYEVVPFSGDVDSLPLRASIREATHLLISAPPGADGDPLLRYHADDLLCAPNLAWIGYLSTVGVYGDHQGAWVDEATPPAPCAQRSVWRLAAEQAWQDLAGSHRAALQIFRLAGIYGPERNALERLAAGQEQRIYKPGQVFNRIHVEDIAATVEAGIRAGKKATGVFNITDDEPAPPQDVIAYAAELLGMEPPPLVPFEQADLSPMARSFYGENKRVRNGRIKADLGVTLAFPTYHKGLGALATGFRR